jgi:predicted transcriptional regulator
MIGVKKNIYSFSKRKRKEIVFINSILRIEKVLNEESCRGVRVVMCCSLNYCQHFLHQMKGILKHKFWNKSFEERSACMLNILKRLHRRGDCNHAKYVMLQEKDVCEITWYKIMWISRSTYMNYKQESKIGCKILAH